MTYISILLYYIPIPTHFLQPEFHTERAQCGHRFSQSSNY